LGAELVPLDFQDGPAFFVPVDLALSDKFQGARRVQLQGPIDPNLKMVARQ
jgi:hypothetical protein